MNDTFPHPAKGPLRKSNQLAQYRILDANSNRALEGLRVVEEFVRFTLDDSHLSLLCKQLRHRLTDRLTAIDKQSRFTARDTRNDVGTQFSIKSEQTRSDVLDVTNASLQRLKEALRCLEEYSKTLDTELAQDFEAIRYQVYTLERAINITWNSCERLKDARLYVLMDGCQNRDSFQNLAKCLISDKVDVVQFRDKSLSDRELLDRASLLRQLTVNTQTLFIMNDRPDLAALSRADGVHLGQEELTVKDARQIVGLDALIGISTHSIQQARQAVLDGANYIGCGPTFPSETKTFAGFPGIPFLSEVKNEIQLPAFAIGGINPTNLDQVINAGMSRVAVGQAITAVTSPSKAIQVFQAHLGSACRPSTTVD